MHIVSKAEREAYKLEYDMLTTDSDELMNAQPGIGGDARAYVIKRRDGSFTFGRRLGCDRQLRTELGVEEWKTIIPGHNGLPANCCKHVLHQDPDKPEGFKLMPYGLFLCKTCFNLLERCRFFRKDVVVNCRDCVETVAIRLRKINPELFDDLRIKR